MKTVKTAEQFVTDKLEDGDVEVTEDWLVNACGMTQCRSFLRIEEGNLGVEVFDLNHWSVVSTAVDATVENTLPTPKTRKYARRLFASLGIDITPGYEAGEV